MKIFVNMFQRMGNNYQHLVYHSQNQMLQNYLGVNKFNSQKKILMKFNKLHLQMIQ